MDILKIDDGLKITGMRQGVKNTERVNVFVNGQYEFSLFVSQVVELGVKVGRVLSTEELAELKRASEFGKLYQRALEWVLVRPRSEKETFDYLKRKIFEKKLDKNYIFEIISKLKEKKYLDDRVFCRYYVENRMVKKGVSRRRLEQELARKGVSREVVEEVLLEVGRDEGEEIRKMIARKRDKYDDEKLISYLVRQGFSYGLAREQVLGYGKD